MPAMEVPLADRVSVKPTCFAYDHRLRQAPYEIERMVSTHFFYMLPGGRQRIRPRRSRPKCVVSRSRAHPEPRGRVPELALESPVERRL